MENELRRKELADKFLEMGKALLAEGSSADDYCITQSGSLMVLVSNLMASEKDMFDFSELTSMFSAKKFLDGFRKSNDFEKFDSIMDIFNNLIKKTEENTPKKKTTKPRKNKGDN